MSHIGTFHATNSEKDLPMSPCAALKPCRTAQLPTGTPMLSTALPTLAVTCSCKSRVFAVLRSPFALGVRPQRNQNSKMGAHLGSIRQATGGGRIDFPLLLVPGALRLGG